jgi:glycosyltransferase involved in cell wall biosynthesis
LAKRAAGYFAYTLGVKEFLVEKGMSPDKIFVINNTIDIQCERQAFDEFSSSRQEIRRKLGLIGSRVLLFIGRFTPGKRLDFLLNSFQRLNSLDDSYRLLLVGSGELSSKITEGVEQMEAVVPLGKLINRRELAPVYVASDLFVFPGDVGLGPLQALCYNLPVITIASPTHKPEFEYLNAENAVILPRTTTVEEYADAIHTIFTERERLERFSGTTWPSIAHLTIENMASKFLEGIDRILMKYPVL